MFVCLTEVSQEVRYRVRWKGSLFTSLIHRERHFIHFIGKMEDKSYSHGQALREKIFTPGPTQKGRKSSREQVPDKIFLSFYLEEIRKVLTKEHLKSSTLNSTQLSSGFIWMRDLLKASGISV